MKGESDWRTKASILSMCVSLMYGTVTADNSLLFISRQELNKKELRKHWTMTSTVHRVQ